MVSPILTSTPQPADILSVSQSDLLDNFNYFEVALTKDHQLTLNDGSDRCDSSKNYHCVLNGN